MGFNQVSDKQYEEFMVKDGSYDMIAEWKKLKEEQAELEQDVYDRKVKLNVAMIRNGSHNLKIKKIEEILYMDNKSVL